MIRLIIFEDEPAAMRRIKRLISEIRPEYKIAGDADNIDDGVELLNTVKCDLILSDVRLSDGLCFDIFEKTNNKIPVIFITAYDQYAITTFDYNSIHYLVKPISKDKLHKALTKFEEQPSMQFNTEISDYFRKAETHQHKKILSKVGNVTRVLKALNIALVYFEDRSAFALPFSGKEHLLDYSLNVLMNELPDDVFFKINRRQIINKDAIKEVKKHPGNRLKIVPSVHYEDDLIVSKERTPAFRRWLES